MIRTANFLTDALFAFFGVVTGTDTGLAPGYAVLGGAVLIGGLLAVFLLAALLTRHAKVPLPPEERETSAGSGDTAGDNAACSDEERERDGTGHGADGGSGAPRDTDAKDGDVPEKPGDSPQ